MMFRKGMTTLRTEARVLPGLRDRICARLEELDGGKFQRTKWTPGGGGGEMSELRGEVCREGRCNFSAVWGDKYPAAVDQPSPSPRPRPRPMTTRSSGFALPPPLSSPANPLRHGRLARPHPRNPFVPVVHLNVRYLEAGDVSGRGGTDLTPCREFVEDTRHFHRVLQKVCNAHGPGSTTALALGEGVLLHRHRGASGRGRHLLRLLRGEERWSFVRDVASLPAGVRAAGGAPPRDSVLRRGPRAAAPLARPVVEFNLIYDRGTLFGCARRQRSRRSS